MNKNYLSGFLMTAVATIFSLSANASVISTETTIPMTAASMGQTFKTGDPDEFEVKGVGIEARTQTILPSWSNCGGMQPNKAIWYYKGASNETGYIDRSSYIEINITGTDGEITDLYLDGSSTDATTLVVGFSSTTGGDWDSYSGGIGYDLMIMSCAQSDIDVPAGTKSIRIVRTSDFFAGKYGGADSEAFLKELKVTTEYDDESTGIDPVNDDLFSINYSDNQIYVSEPAAITLYTVSGELILQSGCTDNLSIENLPKGIYVVAAESNFGKSVKKIVK